MAGENETTGAGTTEIGRRTIYYHQSTPEIINKIAANGFKKEAKGGADLGLQGFIRGTFLKETSELITDTRLGQSQMEVELRPGIKILDLTNEYPGSFVQEKSAWEFPGRQAFALAGWLERNGYSELAENYHEGIRRVYSGQEGTRLDFVWKIVEQKLKELGYGGVRFTDFYKDSEGDGHRFPAVAVFDPENIMIKQPLNRS